MRSVFLICIIPVADAFLTYHKSSSACYHAIKPEDKIRSFNLLSSKFAAGAHHPHPHPVDVDDDGSIEHKIHHDHHHHHRAPPSTSYRIKNSSNTLQKILVTTTTAASILFMGGLSGPVAVAVSGGGLDYAGLDISGRDFSNGDYKGKDFTQVSALYVCVCTMECTISIIYCEHL